MKPKRTAAFRSRMLRKLAFTLALLCALCAVPAGVSGAQAMPSPSPAPTLPPDSKLALHFIDVGQGDAILVTCDGHAMLVDGGGQNCGSLVVAYLKKQGITELDYVVNTHAHEDHVGGLAGVINAFDVGRVFSSALHYDSDPFRYFKQHTEKKGLALEVPEAGETWALGSARVTVLAPATQEEAGNDASLVLMIRHGACSYLLMGDAGEATEKALLDAGADLRADVLKVGHHGDAQTSGYAFLREVMPKYAVLSVGAGNSYGHPTEAVLSKLSDAGAQIFRTDLNGTVVLTGNGETIESAVDQEVSAAALLQLLPAAAAADTDGAVSRSAPEPTDPPTRAASAYIGNKNSKKFHKPSCSTLPDEKNRVYFDSRDKAIGAGYVPCKRCHP